MEWRKKFHIFRPGDKILCIKRNGIYEYGKIYTLKQQYIKDGKYIAITSIGEDAHTHLEYWLTREISGRGISSDMFEAVK